MSSIPASRFSKFLFQKIQKTPTKTPTVKAAMSKFVVCRLAILPKVNSIFDSVYGIFQNFQNGCIQDYLWTPGCEPPFIYNIRIFLGSVFLLNFCQKKITNHIDFFISLVYFVSSNQLCLKYCLQ